MWDKEGVPLAIDGLSINRNLMLETNPFVGGGGSVFSWQSVDLRLIDIRVQRNLAFLGCIMDYQTALHNLNFRPIQHR